MADKEKENDNLFEEWKQAREVLKTFDDRIHDLRKYGFTFVTALMAAEGILLPWNPPIDGHEPSGIPDEAKLGVFVATALLIIGLRWFDGNYQGFLYGASMRARVIERFLNLELTNQIAVRYAVEKLWLPKIILYVSFEVAVIGLAFALLPGHTDWICYFIIAVSAESLSYYFLLSPERLKGSYGGTDWTLDKDRCKSNEIVRIMVTNFNPKNIIIRERWKTRRTSGNIEWETGIIPWIVKDSNGHERHRQRLTDKIIIKPGFSYIWSFIPREIGLDNGIFRFIVNFKLDDERELARKLLIEKN